MLDVGTWMFFMLPRNSMAQILKFPVQASKLGYKRVRKRAQPAESQNQLHLFSPLTAQILDFAPDLSRFEQALLFDERGDAKAAADPAVPRTGHRQSLVSVLANPPSARRSPRRRRTTG